jgi:hypothetical protein
MIAFQIGLHLFQGHCMEVKIEKQSTKESSMKPFIENLAKHALSSSAVGASLSAFLMLLVAHFFVRTAESQGSGGYFCFPFAMVFYFAALILSIFAVAAGLFGINKVPKPYWFTLTAIILSLSAAVTCGLYFYSLFD